MERRELNKTTAADDEAFADIRCSAEMLAATALDEWQWVEWVILGGVLLCCLCCCCVRCIVVCCRRRRCRRAEKEGRSLSTTSPVGLPLGSSRLDIHSCGAAAGRRPDASGLKTMKVGGGGGGGARGGFEPAARSAGVVWTEYRDDSSGRSYFVSADGATTTWDRPTGGVIKKSASLENIASC